MPVILNDYEYEIIRSCDNNGNQVETTMDDELEAAIGLDIFMENVKSYSDKEIKDLSYRRKNFGLIDTVLHELYDAFFDLVFYGNRDESWFLKTFNISKNELSMILE